MPKKTRKSPPQWRTRWGYPFSPSVFNIIPEIQVNATRQQKEMRCTQTGKEEIKLSFLPNDTIIYAENPKESTTTTNTTISWDHPCRVWKLLWISPSPSTSHSLSSSLTNKQINQLINLKKVCRIQGKNTKVNCFPMHRQ